MSLKAMTEAVVKLCVHEPDVVSVHEGADRGGKILTVIVAPNDVGRLIGKDGRVISCIRSIISAAAAKAHTRAQVKVKTED
jgi:uncharacterized protein